MASADIETDPFFIQLTDALRAGPGTPQWNDAIAALRNQGAEGADELRVLIQARENLENGKDFRSVRAGPGFTRKLMAEIENSSAPAPRSTAPTATIIAIIAGLAIFSLVGYVGYKLTRGEVNSQQAIDDLQSRSQKFFDAIATASFSGSIPQGWRAIGSLPLSSEAGLRPDLKAEGAKKDLGGGVVWNTPLAATQPFAVDVSISAPEPSSAVLLEAFVSTDPNFSPEKGTSSKDLVWQLQGREQHVLLSGGGQALLQGSGFANGDAIRLIVDQNVALVEVISATGKTQRLWSGPHDLGAGPRYVGVRFLQTGAAAKIGLSVQQIKITTASPE